VIHEFFEKFLGHAASVVGQVASIDGERDQSVNGQLDQNGWRRARIESADQGHRGSGRVSRGAEDKHLPLLAVDADDVIPEKIHAQKSVDVMTGPLTQ